MRILLVEDEVALAELVAARLKKERYVVDVFHDGEEGLYNALTGIYDLAVLDIMLPKKDGLSILREMRQTRIPTKVIMLTAKGELSDKLAGFGEGANDYVPKPFHMDELVARIHAQLRIEQVKTECLQVGNILLDYKKPAAVNADTGECIPINNKEFQLLEYFMRNPNQVLAKDLIFDRVWGMENESMSNNLEAYISFVRKKLKVLEASITIKSIRNMGYKLESTDEGIK
ncbi:DNA-binding response regulator, OmpR family, contains REC and winged-helix (wHTH) domain [Lachnospiraceae bacterium XBB1006]|nr:DNA-binding response regulator, OmpR family, contains REC and winged-helix (wHTH) domain [Lachnospiraceae bacterium XBB1006]